jgi:branched-chain amino acid transport system substrate-binding protein
MLIKRAGSADPEAIRQALAATDLGPNDIIMPWDRTGKTTKAGKTRR